MLADAAVKRNEAPPPLRRGQRQRVGHAAVAGHRHAAAPPVSAAAAPAAAGIGRPCRGGGGGGAPPVQPSRQKHGLGVGAGDGVAAPPAGVEEVHDAPAAAVGDRQRVQQPPVNGRVADRTAAAETVGGVGPQRGDADGRRPGGRRVGVPHVEHPAQPLERRLVLVPGGAPRRHHR